MCKITGRYRSRVSSASHEGEGGQIALHRLRDRLEIKNRHYPLLFNPISSIPPQIFVHIINMEAADLLPLLEQLDDNIDDLEEALKPILDSSVVETSKKLPVMDKAKFHVLVTYALESLIFCTSLLQLGRN